VEALHPRGPENRRAGAILETPQHSTPHLSQGLLSHDHLQPHPQDRLADRADRRRRLGRAGGLRLGRDHRRPHGRRPRRAHPDQLQEPANNLLPKNYRIVSKHIEVARGEKASTVMTAPEGFRIVTIGFGDGHQVGGAVNDVNYSGKRSVRVKLFTNNAAVPKGATGKGTLYILAKRA
jgi:hypothetical protein